MIKQQIKSLQITWETTRDDENMKKKSFDGKYIWLKTYGRKQFFSSSGLQYLVKHRMASRVTQIFCFAVFIYVNLF